MPRRVRLDTPGTLYRVIVRGIEKRRIVNDVAEREDFVRDRGVVDWQDREYVLKWFGNMEGEARNAYRNHVKKAIGEGRRTELVGGGLIPSPAGWSAMKSMRRAGERELSDDRVAALISFDSFLIL